MGIPHHVEVYPRAAFERWGLPMADRSARAEFLTARVGPFDWTITDELDAITAAIVTAEVAIGTGSVVDRLDGSIRLP